MTWLRRKGSWTDHEDNTLAEHVEDGGSLNSCLPKLPGRTRSAVNARWKRIADRLEGRG